MCNILRIFLISLTIICALKYVASANTTKKGLSFGKNNFYCGDVETFSNLNWYYNWGTEFHPECGPQPQPGNFIPMIWGYWGHINEIQADPYDTILGFNEPNHKDQSNLSPEEAAFGWIDLQETYPDKILVSPCASAPNTTQWFDEFFNICKELGCKIDYLATHSYTCNAERDLDFVNDLYERYGLKVWLTEFACSNTKDPEKALHYMKEVLPMLEAAESVWKYSWFVSRFNSDEYTIDMSGGLEWYLDKVNSLLEIDSDYPVLTTLGKYYDEFQPNL